MRYIRLSDTAGTTNNIFYKLRFTGFARSPADVMKDVEMKAINLGEIDLAETADWVRVA